MNAIGPIQHFKVHSLESPPYCLPPKSYFSPALAAMQSIGGSYATYCWDKVVVQVVSIAATVKAVVAKVHVLFLNMYAVALASKPLQSAITQILSLVVFDKESTQKLDAARAKLTSDVNCDYYIETARFLGSYVSQFLKSACENGTTMPVELRSPWLDELLWKKPDGSFAYTFKGQVFSTLVTQNTPLFARYIELALLQGFGRFSQTIQKIQSQNRFAFLDLVKDLLVDARGHLELCQQAAQDPEAQNAFSKAVLQQQENVLIKDLIDTSCALFLPNGADDIELPIRDSLVPHIGPFLLSLLKSDVFPQLVSDGLKLAKTPYVKTLLVNEGLMLEKINIEREYRPLVPALNHGYPAHKFKELVDILQPCFKVGVNYALPDFNSVLKNDLAMGVFAQASAQTMVEEMPKISLQEIVRLGLEKLCLALDETGVWAHVNGKRTFQPSAFRFEHTQEIKAANDERLKQKTAFEHARLLNLVQTIGDDPQRLYQLFQSTLFRTNHAVFVPPSSASKSLFGSVLERVASFYGNVTKQAAGVLVQQSNVKEFIQSLNQSIPGKLLLPEHDRAYVVFSRVILKLLK